MKIQASFATLLETYEPIIDQPTNKDLNWLEFSAVGVLAPISFDEELGKHNLMGLLLSSNDYKSCHNGYTFWNYETFLAIYDDNIAADASSGVCVKAESKHQAKLNNWRIFDCARQELRAFIIASVEDTWIRELRDSVKGYSQIKPKDMLTHLWALCGAYTHWTV